MVFLFFVISIILLLIFSKIIVEIENLKISSRKDRYMNEDYKISIKLCILGNIPIIKININKSKITKKIKSMDINILKIRKEFAKKIFEIIRELKILIKEMCLEIELGTENALLTSMIVPILSTIIVFLIRDRIKEYEDKTFKIKPIYINQNLINIAISSIFEIKMIHIINIIYILNKKEGEDKNERTSNRRAYDYSYE